MPTFRQDPKLGTMVPLMKTDDYNDQSVTEKKLKDGNITTRKLADGSVTTAKIADGNVTTQKIADGSVSNEKLQDDSITNEKLAENSITKDKLKDNTIGVEKLDPELRHTINAATGLPENLVETIQNVDDTLKDHQSQLDDKQSQIDDKQQQITANDEDISLLQTRSTQIEETIKSIAATGSASQATAVTYDNKKSGLKAINAQAAIDEVDSKLSDLSAEASFHFNEGHNDNYNIIFPIKKGNRYLVISTYDGVSINTTKDFSTNIQSIKQNEVFVATENANGIRGWINNATRSGDITIYSGIKVDIFSVQGSIDNLANTKFDKSSIAQETGQSEDKVMSQKAVSSKLSDLSAEASFHFNEGHNDNYNIIFPIKKGNRYLVISTYDGVSINTTKDFSTNIQSIKQNEVFVATENANGIRGWINNANKSGDITIYSGLNAAFVSISDEIAKNEDSISKNTQDIDEITRNIGSSQVFEFNKGHNDYYNIAFPIKKGNKYLVVSTYDGITINTTNDFSGYLQTGIANNKVFVADQDANGIRGYINNATSNGDITIYSGLNISEPTFKKSLFTIGDSLCDTGVWQTHLANLKDMVFDQSINKGQFPISYGGTTTGYIASNSGINRARNLVEVSKKQPVDYVIIENINDRFYVDGKISDSAWMINQTLIPHSTFDTEEEANSYIENLSSILSSIASDKRLKGSVIVVNSKSTTRNAYKLTVTSKAIIDGDITITDSNGMVRSVRVTTDMEITDIASEIARYNFGSGWDTSDNKDGSVTISYYTTPDKTFSFNSNNTGVNVTIEEDYNVVSTKRYFTGYSSSEWEDTTKWVSYINLYQLYKGMLEYLKSNLPNAKIYWLIPTTFTLGFNGTEYANSDGSFNMEKYKESTYYKQMQKLFDCQKEVAKYYDIPILDMEEYSNINLFNAYEFYYANDVHPKANGYRRWAETISKIL